MFRDDLTGLGANHGLFLNRSEYEQRLRTLKIVESRLRRMAQISPATYSHPFIDAKDTLYRVQSTEATQIVSSWLGEGILVEGHINRQRKNRQEI